MTAPTTAGTPTLSPGNEDVELAPMNLSDESGLVRPGDRPV